MASRRSAQSLVLTVAYDPWDPMTDRIAQETTAHAPPIDPVSFYSARVVEKLPRGHTVVNWPQTMLYAGGDPAWVVLGDGRWWIDSERFDYIVLNDYNQSLGEFYVIDALRRLARRRYIQIVPLAWVHKRTAVAHLDGVPVPGVPYWSPVPAWRLPGWRCGSDGGRPLDR